MKATEDTIGMTITICSSAAFYKDLFPIMEELEKRGYTVFIPSTAYRMKESGNYDDLHYKTWYDNPDDFSRKTFLMQEHLGCIDKSDAILVVNHEKKGVPGYIGGNVLLEMFYAWIHKKPIYVLNRVGKELPLYEEVLGMTPVFLGGDLSKLQLSEQ